MTSSRIKWRVMLKVTIRNVATQYCLVMEYSSYLYMSMYIYHVQDSGLKLNVAKLLVIAQSND